MPMRAARNNGSLRALRAAPGRASRLRTSSLAAKSDNAFAPVSLHTIVRFNKMKRLCKGDAAVAAAALRSASTALEVDPSGGSVRRLAPLPASDPLEIGSRTVVAENLPSGGADGAPTAASLDALFAKAGRVRMLRVCPPTASGATGGRSTLQSAAAEDPWGALNVVSTQTHALVEYETRGEALAAVAQLNDGTNWRTGLRVRLVRREGPAFARNKAVEAVPAKGASATEGGAAAAAADGAEGWEAAESGAEPPAGEAGGEGSGVAPKTHKAGAKGGKKEKAPKRDYAAWASAGAHRETQQRERAAAAAAAEAWGPDAPGEAAAAPTAASSAAEPASSDGAVRPVRRFAPPSGAAAAAPGGGPAVREAAMPDGTRGFTRGRGRPLASPFAA